MSIASDWDFQNAYFRTCYIQYMRTIQTEGDFLRILIYTVPKLKFFLDLKIVNNVDCATFQVACRCLGFLENCDHLTFQIHVGILSNVKSEIVHRTIPRVVEGVDRTFHDLTDKNIIIGGTAFLFSNDVR